MLFHKRYNLQQYYNKPLLQFAQISTYSIKPPNPPNKNIIIITIIACSLFLLYKKR